MRPPERVLVIDPGDRTGWARCVIEGAAITSLTSGVSALKDFAIKMAEVASEYDTFVYETWRLRPDVAKKMVGNDFQPSQLIGMIRLMGWITPGLRLASLEPAVKKTGIKVMLPELAARCEQSSEEHDKDALALLSYYHWKRYTTA